PNEFPQAHQLLARLRIPAGPRIELFLGGPDLVSRRRVVARLQRIRCGSAQTEDRADLRSRRLRALRLDEDALDAFRELRGERILELRAGLLDQTDGGLHVAL